MPTTLLDTPPSKRAADAEADTQPESPNPLAAQLKNLQNDRAVFERARAKKREAAFLAEQIAEAEREFTDAKAVACAEDEIGPIGKKIETVQTTLGVVIVKQANPVLYKKYMDQGSLKIKDLDQMVRPCVVYPSDDKFDRILDEQPAVLVLCADAVARLAGIRVEAIQGK